MSKPVVCWPQHFAPLRSVTPRFRAEFAARCHRGRPSSFAQTLGIDARAPKMFRFFQINNALILVGISRFPPALLASPASAAVPYVFGRRLSGKF